MSKLLEKLMKAGSAKSSSLLSKSVYFKEKDVVPCEIHALNIAFAGDLDGGLVSGLTVIAGPSRHFKSHLGLMGVKAYFNKYPDAACLFYDSEFGITPEYLELHGVDAERIIHIPITTVEQLKFDISKRLEEIERGDHVCIFIDSIGNLASKKEADDALAENAAADMTRAKQMKSLFRIVTPHLTIKDIPMLVVNHTYQCGTADMMVKTPYGDVSLANLGVGARVLTTNGYEEVQFTTKHEGAHVTDIELENGEVLSFTSGHKFKVGGEWKLVEDLRVGDDIDVL
jgi:hypothetical protein